MGWLTRLKALLPRLAREPVSRDAAGWRVLASKLGMDSDFVAWARRGGGSFEEVWLSCHRLDWLLGLAIAAEVPIPLVINALGYCWEDPVIQSESGALATAVERWRDGRLSGDALCATVLDRIDARLEQRPLVIAARAQAKRLLSSGSWMGRADVLASLDGAERNEWNRFAARFRERLAFTTVQRCIFGERRAPAPNPYRASAD